MASAVLHHWDTTPLVFDCETFQLDRFLEEAETMPLFSSQKVLTLKDAEKLKSGDLEAISSLLDKPIRWMRLCILASFSSGHKFVKKMASVGIVFQPKEEKAWEKEKRLSAQLTDLARGQGVQFPLSLSLEFVRRVGQNEQLLQSELEKLLLYIDDKKEITAGDIRAISIHMPGETIWQLGDALFALDRPSIMRIGKQLYEDEKSFFALVASLRHLISSGLKMLTCYQGGGASAVAKEFPHLKGAWLDKKVQATAHYGMERLRNALLVLFEMEVEAKSSTCDEQLMLDILLVKLSRR